MESKKKYLRIAKDLLYPDHVIKRIENASSEEEVLRIIATTRKRQIDAEDHRLDRQIEQSRKRRP